MTRTTSLAFALLLALAASAALGDGEGRTFRDPVLEALLGGKPADETPEAPDVVVEDAPGANRRPVIGADIPDSDEPNPELERLLDRMNEARKEIRRVEAKAVRIRLTPLLSAREDKHEGTLRFEAPRLLHLELRGAKHLEPEDQRTRRTIVTERYAYLWHVEENEAERIELPDAGSPDAERGNPFQYGLAADLRNLSEDYFLTLVGQEEVEGKKAHVIRARPRPHLKDARYDQLFFWVDEERLFPVQFRQEQSGGEIIDIYRLSDIELNPRWWRSPFRPPPRSVNIVVHEAPDRVR